MACDNCFSGYTWTDYDLPGDPRCYRVISTEWTVPQSTVPLVQVSDSSYSTENGRLYTSYNISGQSNSYFTLTATTLWVNDTLSTTDGALNRTGVWADLTCDTGEYRPLNLWMGFSICLGDANSAKTYYVGVAADNEYKIDLDGITIINSLLTYSSGNTTTATYWRIYEIQIPKGDNHTLEIFGLNFDGIASIGAEIYDNTLSEILTATNSGQLNIIYSTRDESIVRSFQTIDGHYVGDSGYTCCDGFVVSTCSGSCLQYIVCGPEPSQSPLPATPTPTPTITPTPIFYSDFVSGCCDDLLYKLDSGTKYIVGSVLRVAPINFCYQVVKDENFTTYDSLDDSSGAAYVSGCTDIKCQPCQYAPTYGNSCDIITIPDMILECVTTDPSYSGLLDGSVSLNITGGTGPYTTVWQTPLGTSFTGLTLTMIGDGSYTATTTDYYGDFTQSIVCTIAGPKICDFELDVAPYPCISPTPTVTPTMTPTLGVTATPAATPSPSATPQSSSLPFVTPTNRRVTNCTANYNVIIKNERTSQGFIAEIINPFGWFIYNGDGTIPTGPGQVAYGNQYGSMLPITIDIVSAINLGCLKLTINGVLKQKITTLAGTQSYQFNLFQINSTDCVEINWTEGSCV